MTIAVASPSTRLGAAPPRMRCFVPDQNTPGKVDMTGAFLPEARAFARFHGQPDTVVYRFPSAVPMQLRRQAVTEVIEKADQPLDVLGFWCHGWRDGIQAGFRAANILTLARLVAMHCSKTAYVLLYACDTGSNVDDVGDTLPGPGGDGGFADELRDAAELLGRQVTVMGHTTAGHCGMNPFARRFAPGEGGKGGSWFVEPESPLWQAWVRALRDPRSTLRFRFWSMTSDEISEELGGHAPLVA